MSVLNNSVLRTTDSHCIYDSRSKKRINQAKSIYIGDHVWLGLNSTLLNGTLIGPGSIVGAGSVAVNKKIPSNYLYSGIPVKKLRENIAFTTPFIGHNNQDEDKSCKKCKEMHRYVYKHDSNFHNYFMKLEHMFQHADSIDKK